MVQPLFGNVPLEALEILPAPGEPWHSFANARNQLAHGDQAAALRSAISQCSLIAIGCDLAPDTTLPG